MPSSPRDSRSYQALAWWITLTMTTAWLPLVRGLIDGPSYQWATTLFAWQLGGRGTSGDFWYPLVRSAVGIALLWAAWRLPTLLARRLIALYAVLTAADITWAAVANPDGFRFQGDTLGIDVSLTWVAPVLAAVFALIAIRWAIASAPKGAARISGLSSGGRRRIVVALALLPVQWALLHAAEGMDWRDMVGVVLTIAQWWLLSAALASRSVARHA